MLQLDHLKRINQLPQVIKNRFKQKHSHYQTKRGYVARCGHIVSNPRTTTCRKCRTGVSRGKWKARTKESPNRYVKLLDANIGKPRYEHVMIAEKDLGRRLKPNECVHHVNMLKWDNNPKNLVICTKAYNTSLIKRYAELYAKEKFRAV